MIKRLGERVLWQRAQEYLGKYKPMVIGVVGSYGTSLTTQAIELVMRSAGKSVRTNNGAVSSRRDAALAILGVNHPKNRSGFWHFLIGSRVKEIAEKEPEVIVLNIKAEKPGDIDALASTLPLSVGVVTAIDAQALHLFQTTQMVAHEHESLLASLPRNGLAVINQADPLAAPMPKHCICSVATIGANSDADVEFIRVNRLGLNGFAGEVRVGKSAYEFLFPHLVGKHQLNAAAFALAIAYKQGMEIKKAVHSLKELKPLHGELSIVVGKNNSLLLDDSSDATPQSILLALKTLAALPAHLPGTHEHTPRRIAILGDIINLGSQSIEMHARMGEAAAEACDLLVVVGNETKYAQATALKTSRIDTHHFDSSQNVGKWLKDYLRAGDIVLISGGKEMQMKYIVEALKEE